MRETISGEVKGVPIEMVRVDEETGEICIGDECLLVRLGKENLIQIEYNPDSQKCSIGTRQIIKKFMREMLEDGHKAKVKFFKKTADSQ